MTLRLLIVLISFAGFLGLAFLVMSIAMDIVEYSVSRGKGKSR